MFQQAIGGIEGEMRVALQYLFQSWNSRGPKEYRDMLLETGTEKFAHSETLAAVALNLGGAAPALKELAANENPAVAAALGGMDPLHYLSTGLGAMAADIYAHAMAEATGRALATRLYEFTDDPV